MPARTKTNAVLDSVATGFLMMLAFWEKDPAAEQRLGEEMSHESVCVGRILTVLRILEADMTL